MDDTESKEVKEEVKEEPENLSEKNEENAQTDEAKTQKEPFKLNPEIKGMIGLFCVILVLGLIMSAYMGKFEQWFGIDIFAGGKITNKIVYIEKGDVNKIKTYDTVTAKTEEIYSEKDIKDVAVSYLGTKILYVGYVGDTSQVFLMDPDGKKKKPITTIEGAKSKPKFSPDGKYISYIANGRLFRADINGSNSFSMLPTKQQQQKALAGRDGKLVIKDYVWSNTGEGMLAVVSYSEEDERLILMSDNNGDAHEVPFPPDMNCKFVSLSSAPDANAYVAIGKSHGVYIMFMVQVPEEHNHATETMSAEEMGVVPMPLGKDKVSYATLLPQGAGVMLSMKTPDKNMPEAVMMLDFKEGKVQPVLPMGADRFDFLYTGQLIVWKQDGDLLLLDQKDTAPITAGNNVDSYSIAPPKETKK